MRRYSWSQWTSSKKSSVELARRETIVGTRHRPVKTTITAQISIDDIAWRRVRKLAAQHGRSLLRGQVITGFQQAGQQFRFGGEGTKRLADGHRVPRAPDDLDAVPGPDLARYDHSQVGSGRAAGGEPLHPFRLAHPVRERRARDAR